MSSHGTEGKGPHGHRKRGSVALTKALRTELDLSQQQLAELLRVSVRTVSRWECGTVEPDPDLRKRIVRLRRLVDSRLKVDRDPESVLLWLTTPQPVQCVPVDLLSSERAVIGLQVAPNNSLAPSRA
jgi:transcriptional regulator with XRE-family HTH domain